MLMGERVGSSSGEETVIVADERSPSKPTLLVFWNRRIIGYYIRLLIGKMRVRVRSDSTKHYWRVPGVGNGPDC